MKFTGVDRLLREQGAGATQIALEHVITTLQSAAAANGVTYLATDIGPDGGKVVLSAGAPRRVGHDEDRMIATLRSALDAVGVIPLGAGATSGRAFAGDYGPSYRRTYSLMGDCVNLAARLAQHAANGELLATRELVAHSSGSFATTEHPPLRRQGQAGARPRAEHRRADDVKRAVRQRAAHGARGGARDLAQRGARGGGRRRAGRGGGRGARHRQVEAAGRARGDRRRRRAADGRRRLRRSCDHMRRSSVCSGTDGRFLPPRRRRSSRLG